MGKFGTGCIDGVIAPEVANNASVGGALIPFISLGIPGDLPTMPFILSFVLGDLLETNLRRAMSYSSDGWITFFTRPVSCILIIVAVFSVVWSFAGPYLKKAKTKN